MLSSSLISLMAASRRVLSLLKVAERAALCCEEGEGLSLSDKSFRVWVWVRGMKVEAGAEDTNPKVLGWYTNTVEEVRLCERHLMAYISFCAAVRSSTTTAWGGWPSPISAEQLAEALATWSSVVETFSPDGYARIQGSETRSKNKPNPAPRRVRRVLVRLAR